MMDNDETSKSQGLTRREVLSLVGMAGIGFLTGCGGGGSTALSPTTTTSGGTTGGTTSDACAVTQEGEIGPYFADDSASGFNRSNVLTNIDGTSTQVGIPLALKIYVYDAENNCAALQGAQVDIWCCNALGVYSDEASQNTSGLSWLRGYQITDAAGLASFATIFPGWYQGRTTHIHVRVRSKYSEASSTSDGTNTTQVFFPQSAINYINTSVYPYSTHGTNSTTNAGDRVYSSETKGEMELVLSGDYTNGYSASIAIHLPITSS